MKMFFHIVCVLVAVSFLSGCVVQTEHSRNGGGRANLSRVAKVSPTVSDLSIFGSQPQEPTDEAVVNVTTWGAVYGDIQGWNELRPKANARVQSIGVDTPIYFDKTHGWAWKKACHNRLLPFQEEEVGGVEESSSQRVSFLSRYRFELGIPVSVNFIPASGGYYYSPRSRVCVPRYQVPCYSGPRYFRAAPGAFRR